MRQAVRIPVAVLLLLLAVSSFAQSIPTATITGRVTAEGAGLPGVTVSVASPNLQGTRTAVTSEAGDYLIPLLPPGEYTITYELAGMQTVTRRASLTAARTDRIDIGLRPASVAEAITVTADTPMTAAVESTQVSTNFKQSFIEDLPIARNVESVTLLSPGVNDNGPGDNVIISGAMSFDSLYLVNGAVVNENLRGQAHDLFIEDAIQETTVLTGGISAEYGHFTGGVVSAITKSGGNEFDGSFRTSLTNESWESATPLTEGQEDTINPVYEATFGGPFLRDRLWFFGAGRFAKDDEIRQTEPGLARTGDADLNGNFYTPAQISAGTPLPVFTYPNVNEETRLEGKLTGTITNNHTAIISYLDIAETETNQTGQTIMDLDSLVEERETPNTLLAVNYNGVLTSKLFVEAQYSRKDYAFLNTGSPYYDNIKGTLITDRARGTRYWSPTFRSTPDGEQRDIEVYTVKGTYFLPTPRGGNHEFRVGYEDYNEVRAVNNYQNGSDFRISVPNTIVRGDQIFPRMPGGASGTLTRISYLPILVLSNGSDYTTRSAYINDRWTLNNHWTFNLGLRYDKNDAISGDGETQLSDSSDLSPRLAAHYDVFGNARFIVNATYGHYVGRLAEGAANDADPAGRNASFQWDYRGPSINNDVNAPTSQLVPTEEAIKRVLDWFFANQGIDRRPFRTTPSLPGIETILGPEGLQSPLVKEWTVGAATALGTRGYARADVVLRNWDRFYTAVRNMSTGRVEAFGSQYDLSILETNDDVYDREYTAVQTQFNYRVMNRLTVGGTYTWSRLVGNVTGEDTGSGPLVGVAAEYPEYRQARWNYPMGYLTGDQRNRAKVWGSYDLQTPVGAFNFSLLQSFDSGTRTSVDGDIDTRPYVTNPGYLTPPGSVSYFFGGRGNLATDDIFRTDFALNYKLRLVRGIELFIQPEVLNLFNRQGLVEYDEEVLTALDCVPVAPGGTPLAAPCPATGLQRFNPFTEEPVEGVHFLRGPNFGKAAEEDDFQLPRTFRMSIGLRF